MNGLSAEKDFAYILGLCFGDGHIEIRSNENFVFKLQTIDIDFAEHAKMVLQREIGKTLKVRCVARKTSSGSQVYEVSVGNIYFKKIVTDTDNMSHLPLYIWGWDRDVKMCFLQGVMDSDGWISARTNGDNYTFQCGYSITFSWVLDIKRMFEDVGIHTKGIIESIPKPPRKPFYRFAIVMKDLASSGFYFNIGRKQRKLDLYSSKHFRDGEYCRFTTHRNSQRLHDKPE